jgi:thiol-disulfide isomerase/thioredoxin
MFHTSKRSACLCASIILGSVALGCSPPIQGGRPAELPSGADQSRALGSEGDDTSAAPTERLAAVIVNGGGEPRINYYSHLDHVRRLLRALEGSGVPPERIAVFSGDGADPEPDLATREGELPADFWVLPRSLDMRLRPPIEYINSEVPGFALRKASLAALRAWFVETGSTLTDGDTLLFYVTDHGEKNSDDLANNSIMLWGEELSVSELRELLGLLDPNVRVVMLMSQCYSGSFANAIYAAPPESGLRGNVCGYFSATADRKAHGCYAEISGKDAEGHSHRMFDALASLGSLPAAQREVLLTDDTPDVPHATTSFFLEDRLESAAAQRGVELSVLIDELLVEAWRAPRAWEREIRLLDRIGETFGFASQRLLSDLDRQTQGLVTLAEQIETYRDLWEDTLETLKAQNLAAFKASNTEWAKRLLAAALRDLDTEERRRTSYELLEDLGRFTDENPELSSRLQDLHDKREASKAAAYRSEVRLAAVLRMRALLVDVAGRQYMEQHAASDESSEFIRLQACEDLTLARLPDTEHRTRAAEPFPTLAAERLQLEEIVPAWLGMRFRSPTEAARSKHQLPGGATAVMAVFPDSPAAEAELQIGDIVLGPSGSSFDAPKEVREWVMQGEIGRPVGLRVLRDEEEIELTIQLARYPLKLPELPGRREVGSKAPDLDLEYLPGGPRLADGRAHLLFFWASWCGPCKLSIPEVLAFGRDRGVDVVAISDEPKETIQAFLDKYPDPFPEIVATDPKRAHFHEYGVSGTPTFVWVDAAGTVRHSSSGYNRSKGLPIDGWQWDGAAN